MLACRKGKKQYRRIDPLLKDGKGSK